jgi:hypothetical protein
MSSKGVGFTIESYGKVEISYINVDVRGYLQGSENGRVVTIGVLAAILKMADILII